MFNLAESRTIDERKKETKNKKESNDHELFKIFFLMIPSRCNLSKAIVCLQFSCICFCFALILPLYLSPTDLLIYLRNTNSSGCD